MSGANAKQVKLDGNYFLLYILLIHRNDFMFLFFYRIGNAKSIRGNWRCSKRNRPS